MAKEKIKYVANITLKNVKGVFIPTATIFYEEDINPIAFKDFIADGTIFPEDQAEVVTNNIPGMRNLVEGLNVAPKLVKKGTITDKTPKSIPAVIWDFDPEKIKTIPFEILMAMYKERCEKYFLSSQNFSGKEEVLVQLSSQFVKK
jgi:hypothetical protein